MRRVLALAALLAAAAPAHAADAYSSDWAKSLQSSARLIAAGGGGSAEPRVGVEITLEGAALTYWRSPGDAGVPPVFNFRASQNLAKAEVLYPAPTRFDENGSEIFGWRRGVVFPINVTPADPTRQVTLDLMLDYGACDRICVPAQAHLSLVLPAAASPPGPQAARIALAETLVPQRREIGAPGAPGVRAVTRLPDAAGGKPAFMLDIGVPPGGAAVAVFAEAPDYFFLKTGAALVTADGGLRVPVTLEDMPKDAKAVDAVFTLTAGGAAVEVRGRLDVGAPKP